ncbi:MAG: acid phosphatase [Burkholderiales bacterium]
MHNKIKALLFGLIALWLSTQSWAENIIEHPVTDKQLQKIQHVVVIYGENRSFDNLYGLFPGADGIADARQGVIQVDNDGSPLARLPDVWVGKPPVADPSYPRLPNRPFQLDGPLVHKPYSVETRDLVHRFYQNQEQIDGGKMDKYAAVSDAGGLTMGYYDGSTMKLWKIAQKYTLADHFFMGAFGGSFLNHMWMACACTPVFPHAPAALVASLDGNNKLARKPASPPSALDGPPQFEQDGAVTPDGYGINTLQSSYQPSGIPPAADGDNRFSDAGKYPLPPQTEKTIGDALSDKNIGWAWYAGGWNKALQDGTQPPSAKRTVIYAEDDVNFQAHHQPFNYFKRYAPGTPERAAHLKDGEEFLASIKQGKLPSVAFYKPEGKLNQHPGYADVAAGDAHIAGIIAAIQKSPLWHNTLIIITYDENGGFWDHVPPPKGDRWGPSNRVPALIVSPYAKKGYVDHTPYDTTSILKFITRRFKLEPLPGIRPALGDLTGALQF